MAIEITAAMVNELRKATGVGMMQCKKALIEAEGNQEKAVELLRKQGAAVAAKRADKAAKEGRIYLVETADKAAAFELSCETEPVSNNEDFKALAALAVKAVETQNISSVEDLKNAVVDGKKVNDVLQDVLVKIQENIDFRKFGVLPKASNSVFGVYSHMMGKIGVITELSYEGSADEAALKVAAKDIAMQAAAFAPIALKDSDVPAETIAKSLAPRSNSLLNSPASRQSRNLWNASSKVASPRFSRNSFSKTRNSSCPKRTPRSFLSRTTSKRWWPSSSGSLP